MNYDTWKSTNPADNELGRSNGKPTPYRCLDCAWRGHGAIAQSDHYRLTGHHTVWAHDPRPLFTQPPTPKPMISVCSWCPDAIEQTAAARAQGFDVTHGLCEACEAKWR